MLDQETLKPVIISMRHAYSNDVRYMDHVYTKQLTGRDTILREFGLDPSGDVNDNTGKESP